MSWNIVAFGDLSLEDLYRILQIRNAVFIVEQNCPYQDLDNKDFGAYHLFYRKDNAISAYCRILPAGASYKEVSIGRVLTVRSVRKQGLGKVMMETAIQFVKAEWPRQNIRISAQKYLQAFYESFGFKAQGADYLEDNIPHVEMLLDLTLEIKK